MHFSRFVASKVPVPLYLDLRSPRFLVWNTSVKTSVNRGWICTDTAVIAAVMRTIYPVPGDPDRSFMSLFHEAATSEGDRERTILIQPSAHIVIDDDTMLILKKNNVLVKIGMLGDDIEHRPLITSSAHSVFKVAGRRSYLYLENIVINHTCCKIDQTLIGSCIFTMHHANIELHNCDLLSFYGFGLWAVQNSKVIIFKSSITSVSRSGIVMFGSSVLDMKVSTISNCRQHGICLRGSSMAILTHCDLLNNGVRAIYAYLTVSLHMQSCRITGTKSTDHAAVDVWSTMNYSAAVSREEKYQKGQVFEEKRRNTFLHKNRFNRLQLTLNECVIENNKGIGVRLRFGDIVIKKSINDCIINNNDKGDIIMIESSEANDNTLDLVVDEQDGTISEGGDSIWQFECDNDKWRPFGEVDSNFIEEATKLKEAVINLPFPHDKYKINLTTMVQINQLSHFERAIRRTVKKM